MEAILTREIISGKTACRVAGAAVFIILTALGAFVRVPLPFTPVPVTLQTFFVLLSGAFLGRKMGAFAQIGYIFLGLSGLPIFTSAGSGLLYIFGPTGGYLFGFIIAAFFTGRLIGCCKTGFLPVFAVFCLADFILLSCGVIWLKFLFGYSLAKLLAIGFAPFVFGDLLKASAAAAIYLKLKPRINEIF